MNLRPIVAATAAIPLILTLGVAITAAAAGTFDTTACAPPPAPADASGPTPSIQELTTTQRSNAGIIYAVGTQLRIPFRGEVIAIATALQESSLINQAVATDHDSLGLFQQRPSQGWGTPAQILDPVYAATAFYQSLRKVDRWQQLPLTEAAQAVQKSAYPDAYAKWESLATQLAFDSYSANPQALPADVGQCLSSCPPMVEGSTAELDSCVNSAAVFARAQTWLTAWSGGPVPYLSSGDSGSWFHGYRRDCSGYVSMALGLPGPGLNTAGLAARSTLVSKNDLRPGSLLINTAPDLLGHVVIFERWADSAMTSYFGYEQTGSGGTHHRQIPYPYFGDYPMLPYRF